MNRDEYWIRRESEIHKSFGKYAPFYREVVAVYPQAQLPQDFEQRVHSRIPGYAAALPLHPGGPASPLNRLMPTLAMMAAVHVVLRREGWTVDQIGRLSYEVFHNRFIAMPRIARRFIRRVMVSPFFVKMAGRFTGAMLDSGRKDTFFMDYGFHRDPEPKVRMNCSQCGMLQYMKSNDLEEMYRYCNVFDFAQADACEIGLTQPSCLGRGDQLCQYLFTRNPEDTRYPESIRRILRTELEN